MSKLPRSALTYCVLLFSTGVSACESTPTLSEQLEIETSCPDVSLAGASDDPRSIVLENGIVRVTYPQLDSGTDQPGAHMLEVWSGGQWQRALDSWYGDWTFFAAPFWAPAHSAHVLSNTPDAVEIAFEFEHWLDHPGAYTTFGHIPRWWNVEQDGPCTVEAGCSCYLPGCGISPRDWEGQTIFPKNYLDVPKFVRHITFTKVIRLERCASGYFVGYHSTPTLTWGSWVEGSPTENSAGERELGLGWSSSVTFASSGVVVRNPEAGSHKSLEILEQPIGPWWFAAIPPNQPERPFVLFLAEEHPMPSFVWQFDPAHHGVPLIHKMNPEIEPDGRVGRYQAFLGAVPYLAAARELEPSEALRDAVTEAVPIAWP